MKHLAELQGAFDATDDWIDENLQRARALGDAPAVSWERRRAINQEAYFVLAWAQFEHEVDQTCRSLIRKRRANVNWERRRGFDIYNPDDKRLSGLNFEDRLRLVLEGDRERRTAMRYYELRNRVAHGKAFATGIDFDQVVQDLFVISSALTT